MRRWCPHCSRRLKIPPEVVGLTMQCPYCGLSMEVPDRPTADRSLMYRIGRAVRRSWLWILLSIGVGLVIRIVLGMLH